jgi:hypothetical protein
MLQFRRKHIGDEGLKIITPNKSIMALYLGNLPTMQEKTESAHREY